jgi:hypothetical protein
MLIALLVFLLWLPLAIAASRQQLAVVRRRRFAVPPPDRFTIRTGGLG